MSLNVTNTRGVSSVNEQIEQVVQVWIISAVGEKSVSKSARLVKTFRRYSWKLNNALARCKQVSVREGSSPTRIDKCHPLPTRFTLVSFHSPFSPPAQSGVLAIPVHPQNTSSTPEFHNGVYTYVKLAGIDFIPGCYIYSFEYIFQRIT